MGTSQSTGAGALAEASKNTLASWIHLDEVREALLGCVDPSTGTADIADILALEYAHNHRIASEVVALARNGRRLNVGVTVLPAVGISTRLTAEPCGRMSSVTREGWQSTWTRQEVADAIAAASVLAPMALSDSYHYGYSEYGVKACSLWRRCWLPTAMAALRAGPVCSVWTADRIDRMGTVLRALVDLCAQRDSGLDSTRAALPAGVVSDRALDLADAVFGLSKGTEGFLNSRPQIIPHVTDVQENLRGMLSWIDAMERTDVLFDHLLKHHHAERIARMADSDPRLASP
ncbi:hypothetical protein TW95_gp0336 [Pandoravirus inopinatum]|uniref:Uncharacterized protein n=1 Tax=Pandoravirus inopinatum TaxID=1605721 RepID=A0A0B5J5U7_9VIRU|nr:hypothetical protein TW95_gp0336 [Pandoravirus inopinatum]AJF97070.1 hypothetical protein [Pandoravirus inopinatum]